MEETVTRPNMVERCQYPTLPLPHILRATLFSAHYGVGDLCSAAFRQRQIGPANVYEGQVFSCHQAQMMNGPPTLVTSETHVIIGRR